MLLLRLVVSLSLIPPNSFLSLQQFVMFLALLGIAGLRTVTIGVWEFARARNGVQFSLAGR